MLFSGGWEAMVRANLNCRFGERVLLLLGEFPARSFEELFQGVKALPWEDFLGKEDQFPVAGSCLSSQLHSVPDCQGHCKKSCGRAAEDPPPDLPGSQRRAPLHRIRFRLLKDSASLMIDTSGEGLHKRGYRGPVQRGPPQGDLGCQPLPAQPPAARRPLYRPLLRAPAPSLWRQPCWPARWRRGFTAPLPPRPGRTCPRPSGTGSGNWPLQRAPGRRFYGEGFDIDPAAVELTLENAKKAGVGGFDLRPGPGHPKLLPRGPLRVRGLQPALWGAPAGPSAGGGALPGDGPGVFPGGGAGALGSSPRTGTSRPSSAAGPTGGGSSTTG